MSCGATEFEYRAYYNDNTALNLVNHLQPDFSGGAGVTIRSVSGTRFIGLDDARVQLPVNDGDQGRGVAAQAIGRTKEAGSANRVALQCRDGRNR